MVLVFILVVQSATGKRTTPLVTRQSQYCPGQSFIEDQRVRGKAGSVLILDFSRKDLRQGKNL
jgi:hypothetical protein